MAVAGARASGRLCHSSRWNMSRTLSDLQQPINSCSVSSRLAVRCAAAIHEIRVAEVSDLDRLCELEDLTAEGASWSRQQIEAELFRDRATVLVVDDGAGAVAWAVGWAVPFELHVMNVAVHPQHRRRGYARTLLSTLSQQYRAGAEAVLLEVRCSNQAALQLYHSLGFQRVGIRRKYYRDGEDAVLMTLTLEPEVQHEERPEGQGQPA